MADERWERLQTLFDEAMALPEVDRDAFLDSACGDDAALRSEIDALLDADRRNDTGNKHPPYLATLVDPDNQIVGKVVDGWHILERVGSGGMGAVYLAERADGDFEQRAALKIVKKGMDSETVLRRFRQERQILARLNHPNIASLLDGGITEDGRPYFAMEYVDGLPITDYCDQHRLTLEKRLELFQTVCNAVHTAHRGLVVHRDLKPSNIIVTADGTIKLLDFGIAKLLDANEADDRLTRTGMQILTPAYAAPEQLMDKAITTTTDVYALGIVLYELLAGRRPFEVRRTPEEQRKLVLTGNPPKPSAAILQMPANTQGKVRTKTVEAVSEARGARVERLRRQLSGDLDTICLMAIHLEPDHRYPSANQMGEDIRRHLQGLPVVASPDSALYRIAKFTRRHRTAVAASIVVFAAFVAMTVFYTVQLAEERDLALEERAKANEVVRFVTGLFEVSDPSEARGEEVTARDLLDAGAEQIRTELSDRPAVRSTMQRVLGEVYYFLGSNSVAEPLLNSALEQQRELYGEEHLEVATSKIMLGFLRQDGGDYDGARPFYEQALATRRALLGDEHMEVMEGLSVLAFLEESAGDYEKAERLHIESLELGRRLFADDNEFLAESISNLGRLYRILDRADEAEPLLREALAMQERLYGEAHPEIDDTKRQIAGLLRDSRQFDASKVLYQEVIASRRKMLGNDHLEVAHALNSFSQLLSDMGDHDGAVAANREFIEIMKRAYAGPHPSLAAAYHNLATFLINVDDLDAAIGNFQAAIDIQEAIDMPPRHPNRAYPMAGMAGVLLRQERFAEAETMFRDIIELRRETYPEEHVLIWELKSSLGAALTGLGEFAEAEALLTGCYDHFLDSRGSTNPRTERAVRRLLALYVANGNEDGAARFRALLPAD